jgi:hypothetical protein
MRLRSRFGSLAVLLVIGILLAPVSSPAGQAKNIILLG